MSHWNHRVVRKVSRDGDVLLTIAEAYYEVGSEVPMSVSDDVAPLSESLDGLRWVLTEMLKALDKPVLSFEDYDKGIYGEG